MTRIGGLVPRLRHLYRDLFGRAQDPAVSGPISPGRSRTVVGTRWKQLRGALRGGTQTSSPSWTGSAVIGTAEARATFPVLAALITPSDAAADLALVWQSGTSAADPRTAVHGWLLEDGKLQAIANGLSLTIQSGARNIRPIQYLVIVAMDTQGAVSLLSTFAADQSHGMDGPVPIPQFPSARVVWVDDGATAASLAPAVYAYDDVGAYVDGHAVQDLRVLTNIPGWKSDGLMSAFLDRFARADSASALGNNWTALAGTWGITGGRAYLAGGSGFVLAQRDTGIADGFFEWDISVPAGTLPFFGGLFRYQDSNNFFRWINNAANQFQIQTWVGGSFGATILSSGFTWTAERTYRVTIIAYGNQVAAHIRDLTAGTFTPINAGVYSTDSNSRFLTATRMGLYAANAQDTRWDNVRATPLIVQLPAPFLRGARPTVMSGGATLASDTFTAANGTALTAHTPTSGGAWSAHIGTWTIQSNRAICTLVNTDPNATNAATQDVGAINAVCTATITTPAYVSGVLRGGIIVNWTSAQQHIIVRLFRDPSQPGADEIELLEVIAGAGLIQRKVNVGNVFAASTAFQLRVQSINGLIQVLLWDGTAWRPRLSHLTSISFNGTRFGLYDAFGAEAASFDDWTVQAL